MVRRVHRAVTAEFVGRAREMRAVVGWLERGRSVVITGPFGCGRTTLVDAVASRLTPRYRFVHLEPNRAFRPQLRDVIAHAANTMRPHVVVWDDIVRLTAPAARVVRDLLLHDRVQIIAIVERAMAADDLVRLRSILGSAPVLTLNPLTRRDAARYFTDASARHRLNWSRSDIHTLAVASHGFPLGMRLTVEAACRERSGVERT